jgi:hypothetical protein
VNRNMIIHGFKYPRHSLLMFMWSIYSFFTGLNLLSDMPFQQAFQRNLLLNHYKS